MLKTLDEKQPQRFPLSAPVALEQGAWGEEEQGYSLKAAPTPAGPAAALCPLPLTSALAQLF